MAVEEALTLDDFTKRELTAALKEVDSVIGPVDPPIDLKAGKGEIVDQIDELAGLLKPEDKISAKTRAVLSKIKALGGDPDDDPDNKTEDPDDDPEDPEVSQDDDPEDTAEAEAKTEVKDKPKPKPKAKKGPGKIERLIAYLTPLVESGKHTRKELHAKAVKKFDGDIPAGTVSAQLYRVTRDDLKENRWGFVASYDAKTGILKATKKKPS